MKSHNRQQNPQGDLPSTTDLAQIAEVLQGLRFGSVNIIVQDGVIVQIDRTEKQRIRTTHSKTEGSHRQRT